MQASPQLNEWKTASEEFDPAFRLRFGMTKSHVHQQSLCLQYMLFGTTLIWQRLLAERTNRLHVLCVLWPLRRRSLLAKRTKSACSKYFATTLAGASTCGLEQMQGFCRDPVAASVTLGEKHQTAVLYSGGDVSACDALGAICFAAARSWQPTSWRQE